MSNFIHRYVAGGIILSLSFASFALSADEVITQIQKKLPSERLLVQTKDILQNPEVRQNTLSRTQVMDILTTVSLYNERRQRSVPPILLYILSHRDEISKISDPRLDTMLEIYAKERLARYQSTKLSEDETRNTLHEETLKLIPEGTEVPLPRTSDTYQSVVVDISQQRMYVYDENVLIATSSITSGRKGFSTAIGDFKVLKKQFSRMLTSPFKDKNIRYNLHVDYWIQFYKGFGIHDACNDKSCWRKQFGGNDYIKNGSHGCVNTPYEFVKWLYEWVLPNTRISIIR